MKHFFLLTSSLIALSACQQHRPAPIELRGDRFYSENQTYGNRNSELPRYSERQRAKLAEWQDDEYSSDTYDYGVAANIGEVSSSELPPIRKQTDTQSYSREVTRSAPIVSTSELEQNQIDKIQTKTDSVLPPAQEDESLEKLNEFLKSDPQPIDEDVPFSERRDKVYEEFSKAEQEYASLDSSASPIITTQMLEGNEPTESINTQSFISPLRGNVIAPYNTQSKSIGIAARIGEPIRSAANGTVAHVGDNIASLGNMVIINHGEGYVTTYSHMSDVVVSQGDTVIKGELIGFVGKTGNAEQPQLGFGIRKNNRALDPTDVLKN